MHRLVVFLALTACARTAPAPRVSSPEPVARFELDTPIPREELRLHVVPVGTDIASVAQGRWIGRAYDYDGDSPDFAGEAGNGARQVLELGPLGRFRDGTCMGEWTIVPGGGDEAFTPESGAELHLAIEGGCPDVQVKKRVFTVHRLDDGLLVLIDGSTAGVVGYRR